MGRIEIADLQNGSKTDSAGFFPTPSTWNHDEARLIIVQSCESGGKRHSLNYETVASKFPVLSISVKPAIRIRSRR
jgi:hypothetical protein